MHCVVELQVHRLQSYLFYFKFYKINFALCLTIPKRAPNGHVKTNFPHPAKLLKEIFLKRKLKKNLQKCQTLEKIVISNPDLRIHSR